MGYQEKESNAQGTSGSKKDDGLEEEEKRKIDPEGKKMTKGESEQKRKREGRTTLL